MNTSNIHPVIAAAMIIVLLLVVGGVWYVRSTPGIGKPGVGQAGREDPMFAGSSPGIRQGMTRPGGSVPGR